MSPSKLPPEPPPRRPVHPRQRSSGGAIGPRINLGGTMPDAGGDMSDRKLLGKELGAPAVDAGADFEGRQIAREEFRDFMTPERREQIFLSVYGEAKKGGVTAAALLMQYDMGKPTISEEKVDKTPLTGAVLQEALARMREEAEAAGVDMSLLERGIWK